MLRNSLSFLLDGLYVANTRKKGRGVFTQTALAAGTLVEIAPVIVMPAADRLLLDKTLLHDYIFEWGENGDQCAMALGLIPIYNHAYAANCEYEMYFTKAVMIVKTVRKIAAGEELFINYNGDWDNEKKVWFTVATAEPSAPSVEKATD